MNKKNKIIKFLSLGIIISGIGFISLALFNTGAPVNIFSFNNYKMKEVNESTIQTMNPEEFQQPDYSNNILLGDNIGSLTIPTLNRKLPIFQGTESGELRKGVGHYLQSVLPGEKDNCVLSGHRDTVFSKLDELKIGDQLIINTSAGEFIYKIKNTRIVDKDDRTIIIPTNYAALTLSTCYPFYFFGNAQQRYIVISELISSKIITKSD